MGVSVGILISIAAAAVFFFIEPHLLALAQPWRLFATACVFLISTGLAVYLGKKAAAKIEGETAILSDNEVKKRMTAKVDNLEVSPGATDKLLSGNKVGGDANFEIKNSKF